MRQQSVAQAAHSGWTVLPFGAAIDFQEGPGILAKDFRPHGVPLIRLSGLARGASVLDGCNYLDAEMVKRRWSHFALQAGDILLSTSASLGRIATVTPNASGAIAYTGVIRMRPRDPELLTSFIPYLLESEEFRSQAEAMGAGSVIRHFGPTHLKQMTVTIPPRQVQVAIVDTLSAYDELIENSQRRITILESMARALYREWFVHFRFPGHEKHPRVASSLGEIPKGWEVATLRSVTTKIGSGATPRGGKDSYKAEGVHLIRSLNVYDYDFAFDDLAFIDEQQAAELDNVRVEEEDILLNITGASVARCALVLSSLLPARVNQHVAIVRADPAKASPYYVLDAINSDQRKQQLLALAQGGATREALTKETVGNFEIVLPPPVLMTAYDAVARGIHKQREVLLRQTQNLRRTRDLLLPRLMSGQLDVGAA